MPVQLGCPMTVFYATQTDDFRKPNTGMWDLFLSHHNQGQVPGQTSPVPACCACMAALGWPASLPYKGCAWLPKRDQRRIGCSTPGRLAQHGPHVLQGFDLMLTRRGAVFADMKASFFVGDAAGRPGDFADTDRHGVALRCHSASSLACCQCGYLATGTSQSRSMACRDFAKNVGIRFKTPEEVFG